MKKVKTFELTSYQDRRDYEELMNDSKVQVLDTRDFFGIGFDPNTGPNPSLTRVVDYRENAPQECKANEVYKPPMC